MFSCTKFDAEYKRINIINSGEVLNKNNNLKLISRVIDISDTFGIKEYGHCWAYDSVPDTNDYLTRIKFEEGVLNLRDTFHNILSNKQVFYRFYIANDNEIYYGNIKSANFEPEEFYFLSDGYEVLDDNSINLKYDFSPFGSFIDSISQINVYLDSSGSSIFKSTIIENLSKNKYSNTIIEKLEAGTNYYINCISYMDMKNYCFNSLTKVYIPINKILTGGNAISDNAIYLEGEINEIGPSGVSDYGFCYSWTTSNPSLNNNHVSLGNTNKLGIFNSSINVAEGASSIYYRAFITNGEKVHYGDIISIELDIL